ncbi:MAG: nitrogenase component 1 [Chloroflexi bacterium]|nr:nitrogenase component 1 [Chloroflexota bacterium]
MKALEELRQEWATCVVQDPTELGELPWRMPNDTCWLWFVSRVAAIMHRSVVVIHGPKGCGWGPGEFFTMFHSTGPPYPTAARIFTTDMQRDDVVFGASEKLEKTIIEAYETVRSYPMFPEDTGKPPEMVFVFAACAADLIGEDIQLAAQRVMKKIPVKVVAVKAGGYRYRAFCLTDERTDYWSLYEAIFNNLIEPPKVKKEYSVNILGEHNPWRLEIEELKWPLRMLGIDINCVFTAEATLEDIQHAAEANLNALKCESTVLKLAELMKEKYDIPYYSIEMSPLGLGVMNDWVMGIASFFGKEKQARELCAELTARSEARIAEAKKFLKGRKVSICSGISHPMAMYRYCAELGMNPVILRISGGWGKRTERIKQIAAQHGLEPPVMIVRDRMKEETIREVFNTLQPELLIGGSPVPLKGGKGQERVYHGSFGAGVAGQSGVGNPIDLQAVIARSEVIQEYQPCLLTLMEYEEPWYGFNGAVKFVRDIGRGIGLPEGTVELPPEIDLIREVVYTPQHMVWRYQPKASQRYSPDHPVWDFAQRAYGSRNPDEIRIRLEKKDK